MATGTPSLAIANPPLFPALRSGHRLIQRPSHADKMSPERHHQHISFGFSTGTVDDRVAQAIETGTPLVSKRLESLHWLQDRGSDLSA